MSAPETDPRDVHPGETAVPRLWRPATLARHLGFSRQTAYSLVRKGELDHIVVAGAIRIPESSILAYLARCREVQR